MPIRELHQIIDNKFFIEDMRCMAGRSAPLRSSLDSDKDPLSRLHPCSGREGYSILSRPEYSDSVDQSRRLVLESRDTFRYIIGLSEKG